MIDRRMLLSTVAGLSLLGAFRWLRITDAAAAGKSDETFEVQKSDDEWRRQLTGAQYNILREEGTERPFTSPLNKEHRKGTFACAGCDLSLFSSDTKFDSGTGWPSFYQPLTDAVRNHEDRRYMMKRTEVHCRRCGGHLGHVFDDGPKPTGLRYCMNGLSLSFKASAASAS
jgi:peptide-methionine (R)-S-oxide reductase